MFLKTFYLSFFFILISLSISGQDSPEYDIVVDRNGRGHFRNIQQAIDSVRAFNPEKTVTVFIHAGVYKEKLVLRLTSVI